MIVDRIEVFHVELPLVRPWRTAYGEDRTIESLLVRLHSGALSAWGESAPQKLPQYSPEWAGGAFALIRDVLAPRVLTAPVDSPDALQERFADVRGNPFAKAALDTAWWNLEAVRRERPLHALLRDAYGMPAAEHPPEVSVGEDFGVMDGFGLLLDEVGRAFDRGFPRVKLKFRPGWDLPMLRSVRAQFQSHDLQIDCNGAFRLEEHLEMLCRLDDFFLTMIEQPLAYDDLWEHARLQETISTPVCLDESITSYERAAQAIEQQSCRIINLKPGRVGGLTPALRIARLCEEHRLGCWVGGMLESGVGSSINAALAALPCFTHPADVFPSAKFFTDDLTEPVELESDDAGRPIVRPRDVPGCGREPLPARLEPATKAYASLSR